MYRTILLAAAFFALPAAATDLESRVTEHTLDNGMRFLFVERHQAPVFAARLMVRVGGVDEHTGYTGLAHMFEHMAFKGTRRIGTRDYAAEVPLLKEIEEVAIDLRQARAAAPPEALDALRARAAQLQAADPDADLETLLGDETAEEPLYLDVFLEVDHLESELKRLQTEHKQHILSEEFWQIMLQNGATGLNAGTGKDYTVYEESLPANRLELWALLESERMLAPVFREFYVERDVVAEERRQRTDNNPGGKLYEALVTTAFQAHPYGFPTVGWMSDINNFTATEARQFYDTHYVPNNMVAVLVGDFDTAAAIALVEQYFGRLQAGPPPPEIITREPPQEGERRTQIEYDAEPQVFIAFHKPTAPHRDDYVFDVISDLLTGTGRSSRLYKRLVKEDRVAASVSSGGAPGSRYDNLYYISATPLHPHTTADIEAAVYEELERLKNEPIGEREFQKVLNNLEAGFVRRLSSNEGLAGTLAYFETVIGDWRYIANHAEVIETLTPQDIQRVARTYFNASNRTVATLVKKSPAQTSAAE